MNLRNALRLSLATLLLGLLGSGIAVAQAAPDGKPDAKQDDVYDKIFGDSKKPEPKPAEKPESVVSLLDKGKSALIVPWLFPNGIPAGMQAVRDAVNTSLVKIGITVIYDPSLPEVKPNQKDLKYDLPSVKQMLTYGERKGVDYVIAGRSRWATRSIWVGFGPKTKSTCTADVIIVNVKTGKVDLNATGIKMDSTAKDTTLGALGAVFLTPLLTVVSGGPKTPHEQRAGVLAYYKAIEPWLTPRAKGLEPEKTALEEKLNLKPASQ